MGNFRFGSAMRSGCDVVGSIVHFVDGVADVSAGNEHAFRGVIR